MARPFPKYGDSEVLFRDEAMEHVLENCGAQLRAANSELLAAKLRLRDLTAQLLSARDEERRRIARELNDQTVQLLVAIHLRLLDAMCSESRRVARIEECIPFIDQAVNRLRALAPDPRPSEPDGYPRFPIS